MPSPAELHEIVPEYRSANALVRWLFLKRFELVTRLARLETEAPLRILDLGCGEGLFLKTLAGQGSRHSLVGMDHHPKIESLAHAGVAFRRADLAAPGGLPEGGFDRIFCLDVLEHLKDLGTPLTSIRGALKPSGLLILSAPTENAFHKACRLLLKGTLSEEAGPASSPHYHRAATLRREIEARGFTLIAEDWLPLPGPLSLFRFYAFQAPGGPPP
ncbi:MAG: class I SAM-dependent methyltransferase [Elusimicrobia bacterium]|nr:class I SAM-dependent methyltransferase [Elusimicrobiota bacterium]